MNGGAFRRVVEAFFRRWPFYVLLLVAAVALGFRSVANTTDEYTSSGAIFVDSETLVTSQSGVQDGGFFSYLTPAQFTSQELAGLISTDVFMESVLTRAEVDLFEDPAARTEQIRQIRGAIATDAFSESLVQVTVTTPEPELSSRLALATIDEFVQFQISVSIAESGASEEFFTELVADYQGDLVAARSEVNGALQDVENLEDLTPEAQLELERLQEAEVLAAERFRAAVEDVEASRLAMLQTETDVRQRLSTFDPPQTPTEPNGSFLDDLTVLVMFGMVGLMIALLGPVISALLSRGVLFADDLDLGPDTRVIGVIPRVRRKTMKLDQVEVTAQSADISFGPAHQRDRAAAPAQFGPTVGQPAVASNGLPVNAQSVNGQPVNGQPVNGQPVNGQPVNGQPVNGHPVNGATAPAWSAPVVAQPAAAQQTQTAVPGLAAPTVQTNGAAQPAIPTIPPIPTINGAMPGAAQGTTQAEVPRWARPVDATSELPLGAKANPSPGPAGPGNPAPANPGTASNGAKPNGSAAPSGTPPASSPPGFGANGLGGDFDDELDDEDELGGNVVKNDPTRRSHA